MLRLRALYTPLLALDVSGSIGIAVIIKSFFVQMFFVPSASMRPLFIENDRILVQKVSYWGGDVKRGDVVVFNDLNVILNSSGSGLAYANGVPSYPENVTFVQNLASYTAGGARATPRRPTPRAPRARRRSRRRRRRSSRRARPPP